MAFRRFLPYVILPVGLLLLGGISCRAPSLDTGVLRSSDAGENWEQKVLIDEQRSLVNENVLAISVSPHDTNHLLLGTVENGVWISQNKGESWARTGLGEQVTITSLSFSPLTENLVYAGGYVEGVGKIFKSVDGGSTWVEMFSSTHTKQKIEVVQVDWFDDERVYAGTQDASVLRSIDGGENWLVQGRFPSRITDLEISLEDSRVIYIGTKSSGLWRTIDSGKNWERLRENEVFDGAVRVFDVEVDPALPSIIYVASRYGLTRSRDSGDSWEDVPLLVQPGSVSRLRVALDPFSIQSIYIAIDSSFYVSSNFGETWDPQRLTAHTIRALEIDPEDPQTIFMGIQQIE